VRNLALALAGWTGLFFLILFLFPWSLPPGCGNLGGITALCRETSRLYQTDYLLLPYREPTIVLAVGYALIAAYAFARRRAHSK